MSDMTIPPSTSSAFSQGSQKGGSAATSMLNMNAFLTMFTTQLKYQDPTNPMESYELAAQLAQFSSVEKLTSIEKSMSEMQSYLSALNNAQMIQAVGKEITGASNIIQVTGDQITRSGFQLGVSASESVARIRSQTGEVVRTITMGELAAGRHKLEWDGKNDAGQKVAPGLYAFEILALGSDGRALDVDMSVSGTAFAFRMVDGVPFLVLDGENGLLIPTSSVKQVNNPSA